MPRASRSPVASYEARIVEYELRSRTPEQARYSPALPTQRSAARPSPRTGPARLASLSHPRRAGRPLSRQRARVRARARLRRIVALTLVILVADALVSYSSAMLGPSNVGFGVRTVEWLRDNGAAGLVSDIERVYYSVGAPGTGGPALHALPRLGFGGSALAGAYRPAPIAPAIIPALPGEGAWRGTGGPLVRGAPPVLVTTFRPDPSYPQMVAGVAWVDASRAWLQLYPGRYEPPSSTPISGAEVPPQLRAGLLATFNSGFKLEDSGGGFVAFGHVYARLRDGLATFVRLRDGTADIRAWSGGADPGPEVTFARQNLPLIVDRGQLNSNLSDGALWGATLGNAVRVWRSGVGVDARGDILYAAANDQTATSLAQILQRAGAVRAMELDINSEWVTFNFYGSPWAGNPSKLLPGMTRDPTRYLSPDDRDFFAVYARTGG
ncbi:MAG: phosphodiester glycosidase family protein [Actinomycetota bacterium]|nr:phosphodiester glycosidase family protein [Actinomycetota bacterium]